jgi:hypothetical protein
LNDIWRGLLAGAIALQEPGTLDPEKCDDGRQEKRGNVDSREFEGEVAGL